MGDSQVDRDEHAATLTITLRPDQIMVYRIAARSRPLAAYTALTASETRRSITWMLTASTDGLPGTRDMTDSSIDQIASDVLSQIEHWRRR